MIPLTGEYELVTSFETLQRKLGEAILYNNSAMSVVYIDSVGYECNLHFDILTIGFQEDGITLDNIHGLLSTESSDVPTVDVTIRLDHQADRWKLDVKWLKA